MIEVACPDCGKRYRCSEESAGKKLRCKAPHCQTVFRIEKPTISGPDEDGFLRGLDEAVGMVTSPPPRRAPTAPSSGGPSRGARVNKTDIEPASLRLPVSSAAVVQILLVVILAIGGYFGWQKVSKWSRQLLPGGDIEIRGYYWASSLPINRFGDFGQNLYMQPIPTHEFLVVEAGIPFNYLRPKKQSTPSIGVVREWNPKRFSLTFPDGRKVEGALISDATPDSQQTQGFTEGHITTETRTGGKEPTASGAESNRVQVEVAFLVPNLTMPPASIAFDEGAAITLPTQSDGDLSDEDKRKNRIRHKQSDPAIDALKILISKGAEKTTDGRNKHSQESIRSEWMASQKKSADDFEQALKELPSLWQKYLAGLAKTDGQLFVLDMKGEFTLLREAKGNIHRQELLEAWKRRTRKSEADFTAALEASDEHYRAVFAALPADADEVQSRKQHPSPMTAESAALIEHLLPIANFSDWSGDTVRDVWCACTGSEPAEFFLAIDRFRPTGVHEIKNRSGRTTELLYIQQSALQYRDGGYPLNYQPFVERDRLFHLNRVKVRAKEDSQKPNDSLATVNHALSHPAPYISGGIKHDSAVVWLPKAWEIVKGDDWGKAREGLSTFILDEPELTFYEPVCLDLLEAIRQSADGTEARRLASCVLTSLTQAKAISAWRELHDGGKREEFDRHLSTVSPSVRNHFEKLAVDDADLLRRVVSFRLRCRLASLHQDLSQLQNNPFPDTLDGILKLHDTSEERGTTQTIRNATALAINFEDIANQLESIEKEFPESDLVPQLRLLPAGLRMEHAYRKVLNGLVDDLANLWDAEDIGGKLNGREPDRYRKARLVLQEFANLNFDRTSGGVVVRALVPLLLEREALSRLRQEYPDASRRPIVENAIREIDGLIDLRKAAKSFWDAGHPPGPYSQWQVDMLIAPLKTGKKTSKQGRLPEYNPKQLLKDGFEILDKLQESFQGAWIETLAKSLEHQLPAEWTKLRIKKAP